MIVCLLQYKNRYFSLCLISIIMFDFIVLVVIVIVDIFFDKFLTRLLQSRLLLDVSFTR